MYNRIRDNPKKNRIFVGLFVNLFFNSFYDIFIKKMILFEVVKMDELYYFSTCIITPDNTIKGALYLDNEVYIDFNKEAIFITGKKNTFTRIDYYNVLCKTLLLHPAMATYDDYSSLGKGIDNSLVNKAAYFFKNKNLSKLMVNIRGKGYYCDFPHNFRIYKADNEVICDYENYDDINRVIKEHCNKANIIDFAFNNITLKDDKPHKSEKILIEGFLFKFYSNLNIMESNVSKRTFEEFLIRFLYSDDYSISLTHEAIENYKYTDCFEPYLLSDNDGAFNEFTNNATNIIEYYKTVLFDTYELDICTNAIMMLNIITASFKTAYIDEESLKKLHNCRNNDISIEGTKRLFSYLEDKIKKSSRENLTREEFANIIYSVMFFISHGYICKRFSESINGISADREEFNREVLSKYGCTGNPGIYAIYRLANQKKPNSIAVFEAAELEYYGRGISSKPNYEKAFALYKKGCYDLDNFNPMTAWSYAYMLYNYDKKDLEGVVVKKLESLSKQDRKVRAIKPALMAFECGCPAAANLLGQIVADDDIPQEYKTNLKRSSTEYYEIASSEGYVFSKNRLSKYWNEQSSKAVSQLEKEECLKKARSYLKESADLGEPYACNKYASTYLTGNPNDIKLALPYFLTAYNLGNVKTREWAAANLIQYYIKPQNIDDAKSMLNLLSKNGIKNNTIKSFYLELVDVCECSNIEKIRNIVEEYKEKGELINEQL